MARIVLKFGGTSVADMGRINAVAEKVKREVDLGHQIVVTVSAMAGETNKLIEFTRAAGLIQDAREFDSVVATGEQVTSGLLAICLQNLGVSARSWLGWQIPVQTNDMHGHARIENLAIDNIDARLAENQVAVVAGFQGLGPDNRVTTLGRGGSDTTAVALAAALKAERCDIYSDVDGVYTADPRIVPSARKLGRITFEEMLEMSSLGAKILQTRSVEMAMKHGVRVQVLSSFDDSIGSDEPGTLLVNEEEIVEQEMVSSVALSRDEAKITLVAVPDSPGVAANIFGPLAGANVNVDMIVQNISEDGKKTDITFTVPRADLDRACAIIEELRPKLAFGRLVPDANVVKVSVIGVGMRSHAGVAQKMFTALAEKGINIGVISTSEIKISVLIAEEFAELAVRTLHAAYGLDA
ncbi:MAG: aspartate kinase [Alphaproteobacteria bacterium]|nr:aspartate kinase [Alphaproteobacteria bacterium]